MFPDLEVVLLWGFVDRRLLAQVNRLAGECGILADDVDPKRVPAWARFFRGIPVLLDTRYGEYDGALALGPTVDAKSPDVRQKVEAKCRRQHPGWTGARVARAVDQKLREMAKGPKLAPEIRAKRDASMSAMVRFLKELVPLGSITLLLDDGGTMASALGGSYRKPDRQEPRMEEGITLKMEDISAEFLFRFPYWVPVTVVS